MGLISTLKTWIDNENVTYTDLNGMFSTVYTLVNGNIENANVKSAAGIVESKIAMDTSSGHDHDGVNSKAIPKGFVFTINGTLATGTSLAPLLVAVGSQTISKVYVNVKTAPTGANLIIDINKNGTSIWNTTQANRASITASSTSGTQTSFDTTALVEGDILTLDIDQIGSTVAGADLTVIVKA